MSSSKEALDIHLRGGTHAVTPIQAEPSRVDYVCLLQALWP